MSLKSRVSIWVGYDVDELIEIHKYIPNTEGIELIHLQVPTQITPIKIKMCKIDNNYSNYIINIIICAGTLN